MQTTLDPVRSFVGHKHSATKSICFLYKYVKEKAPSLTHHSVCTGIKCTNVKTAFHHYCRLDWWILKAFTVLVFWSRYPNGFDLFCLNIGTAELDPIFNYKWGLGIVDYVQQKTYCKVYTTPIENTNLFFWISRESDYLTGASCRCLLSVRHKRVKAIDFTSEVK
jgi:hypothetical protein